MDTGLSFQIHYGLGMKLSHLQRRRHDCRLFRVRRPNTLSIRHFTSRRAGPRIPRGCNYPNLPKVIKLTPVHRPRAAPQPVLVSASRPVSFPSQSALKQAARSSTQLAKQVCMPCALRSAPFLGKAVLGSAGLSMVWVLWRRLLRIWLYL